MEICGLHLACPECREVIPTRFRMAYRTVIWRISDMIVFRASGIELDGESGLLGLNAEHGLGRR